LLVRFSVLKKLKNSEQLKKPRKLNKLPLKPRQKRRESLQKKQSRKRD
jgi:hypothetical protein